MLEARQFLVAAFCASARYAARVSKQANVELWVKLILPGIGQIGPGKIELLRRIGEQQSIAAAARAMGMSYRRAWLLVDELNKMLTSPVVAKWQGGTSRGGASLTALGEKLVRSYDAMVAASTKANRSLLDELGRSAAGKRRKAQGR